MVKQHHFTVNTSGRGFYDITPLVNDYIRNEKINEGICNLFIQHTSASIILCENADETVKRDLNNFFARLVPDNDSLYQHNAEGADDMPAHIRTVLTKSDLNLPIVKGRLGLGTWQAVYVWEHRLQKFRRKIMVTLLL